MARKLINGTNGPEWIDVPTLLGPVGGDSEVFAGGGNDGVWGAAGSDWLHGGLGNDQLWGNGGDDRLYGDDGNDQLYGGDGKDILDGGTGDDLAFGEAGDDSLLLGAGNDQGYGGAGADTIDGGDGNDSLYGGDGNDTLKGGLGNDVLSGGADNDRIEAGEGDNTAWGGTGDDTILAGAGNDVLGGDDGDDTISAGAGANTVWGGGGNDNITAGAGNDTITGDAGNDTINAGDGNNAVYAGLGDDSVTTGSGADLITGDDGADWISSGAGNDTVYAGNGNDTVRAGAGNDLVTGDAGDDLIDAGAGNDTIWAGDGNDTVVYGRTANIGATDVADGGSGMDTLRLDLTRAEWLLAAVQGDVARYATFLAGPNAAWQSFTFGSFGLTATSFENGVARVAGVDLSFADDAVIARADLFTLGEDATLNGSVVANDTVPDLVAKVQLTTALPAGKGTLALGTDGSFVYNPGNAFQYLAAGESAQTTFGYRVTDADGDTGSAGVTLTITGANDRPVLSLGAADTVVASLIETNAGRTASGSLTLGDADVSDVVTAAVTEMSVTAGANLLPAGLTQAQLLGFMTVGSTDTAATAGGKANWTFNSGSQAFDFLAKDQVLQLRYAVTVNDGHAGTDTRVVTINVTGTNDAAVIGTPTVAAVTEDVLVSAGNLTASGTIAISDADAGQASFLTTTVGTAGNLGTLALAANGTYTYTVANAATQFLGGGQTKVDTFTVSALDGTTRAVTMTVYGQDEAPVAGDDAVTVLEDETVALTGVLLANDTSPTPAKLITAVGTAGTLGSVTLSGGNVSYSAGSAFQYLKAGQTATDAFSYIFSDGSGSPTGTDTANVAVTVMGQNDAPTAGGDAAFTLVGKPVTITVLANDTDPESGALTVTGATGATHGTTAINADGTITYTPTSGYVGTDGFTYVVQDDGGLESTAAVSLVVGRAAHAKVGGDVFLQGQYMEIGVSSAGSLGTASAAPGGFHPTNGGISYVVDADGWDSGTSPATGDFTLPGSPVDTIVLGIGGTSYVQDERSGRHDIGTTTSDTTSGLSLQSTTTGTVAGVRLEQKIDLDPNATYYRTTLTLVNTTGADMSDVRFMRSFDPDQDVQIYNNYKTSNDVLANPLAGSDVAVSRAIGASSGIGVSLVAFDQDARASNYGFANYNAYDARYWASPIDLNGAVVDQAITMNFKIPTLAAGATVTKTFYTAINVNQGANDFVVGTDGANTLLGGGGNDLLLGLAGNDLLTGGTGSDTFIFSRGSGADQITDFIAGAGSDDLIELRGTPYASFSALRTAATGTAGGALLDLGSGDTLLLLGVTVASLHGDDFHLIG